jgi:hypothetical protein
MTRQRFPDGLVRVLDGGRVDMWDTSIVERTIRPIVL